MFFELNNRNSDLDKKYSIIYALAEPETLNIRYIGKSINGSYRAFSHFNISSLKRDGNTKKSAWIKSILKQNKKPIVLVLDVIDKVKFENKTELNIALYNKEQEYINYYKQFGKLTNSQDGGPGSTNRKFSQETLIHMSEIRKNKPLHPALIANQISKYPEDTETERYCTKCNKWIDKNNFKGNKKRKGRSCKPCASVIYKRKSRAIPGAKLAEAVKKGRPIIAEKNETFIEFFSLREAVRYFKPLYKTFNKTSIKYAIENQNEYYGYRWRNK